MECGRNQSAAENKNAIATKVKMSWSSCRGPPITKPFNSLLDAGNRLATAPRFWATCTSHLVGKAPTTAISEVCREPHPVSRDSRCQFLRPWRMPRSRQVHCCEFCRLVCPLTKCLPTCTCMPIKKWLLAGGMAVSIWWHIYPKGLPSIVSRTIPLSFLTVCGTNHRA